MQLHQCSVTTIAIFQQKLLLLKSFVLSITLSMKMKKRSRQSKVTLLKTGKNKCSLHCDWHGYSTCVKYPYRYSTVKRILDDAYMIIPNPRILPLLNKIPESHNLGIP